MLSRITKFRTQSIVVLTFLALVLGGGGTSLAESGRSKIVLETQNSSDKPRSKLSAKELIQKGIEEYQRQQFRTAIATFLEVQATFPKLRKKQRVLLLDYLGRAYLDIAEPDKAKEALAKAVDIYRDRNQKKYLADTLVRLARALFREPDEAEALAHLEEANQIYSNLNDFAGQARVILGKSMLDTPVGPFVWTKVRFETLADLFHALELMKKSGDRLGEAQILMAIGEAYIDIHEGNYQLARDSLSKSREIFQEQGDQQSVIITKWLAGLTYHLERDYPTAIDSYKQAIKESKKAGFLDLELEITHDLGTTYQRIEKVDEAIPVFQNSLDLAIQAGKIFEQGKNLYDLGSLYNQQKNYSKALTTHQQAQLAYWKARGRQCPSDEMAALGIGYLRISTGAQLYSFDQEKAQEFQQNAIETFTHALGMEQKANNIDCEFLLLDKLESEYDVTRDLDNLLKIANRTVKILELTPRSKINNTYDLELLLSSLAYGINFADDPQRYKPILQSANKANQLYGETRLIHKSLSELGRLSGRLGREEDAFDYYYRAYLAVALSQDQPCQTYRKMSRGFAFLKRAHGGKGFERQHRVDNYSRDYPQAIKSLTSALQEETIPLCKIQIINNLNRHSLSRIIENIDELASLSNELVALPLDNPHVLSLTKFLHKNLDWISSSIKSRNSLQNTSEDRGSDQDQNLMLVNVLKIARALNHKKLEFTVLGKLSQVYSSQGRYREALEIAQQGLRLTRTQFSLREQVEFLETLGSVNATLGNYIDSTQYFEEKLAIQRKFNNWSGEISALLGLAINQQSLGNFEQVIAFVEEIFEIVDIQKKKDFSRSSSVLNDFEIGLALPSGKFVDSMKWSMFTMPPAILLSSSYSLQGETQKALQVINIEIDTLKKIDTFYRRFMANLRYTGFVAKVQKSLEAIYVEVATPEERDSFPSDQITKVSQQHNVDYSRRRDHERLQALGQYLSLIIKNFITVRGDIYFQSGNLQAALEDYQFGSSLNDGTESLSNNVLADLGLARVYRDMQLTKASTTYYKKVIADIEKTRQEIRDLPEELQTSFLTASFDLSNTPVSDIYRELADVLISQGRIVEAQEVLELLKQQELNDFTKGTRAKKKIPALSLDPMDQKIRQQQNAITSLGEKLLTCQSRGCEESKISQLRSQLRQLQRDFIKDMQAIEADLQERRLEQVSSGKRDFVASAQKLINAQPDSMLIYPLVLKDKIRLLWASKGGVFSTKTCPLGESEAWQTIAEFRKLLSTPQSDLNEVKSTGKRLYDCFVKPLESEISAAQIKHLIFVPDRATNYIPMSALYDGERFLAEKYVTSSVLSAGLTDADAQLPETIDQTSTLALGVSKAIAGFTALPNVSKELDAIVKEDQKDKGIYPGEALLDQSFDENTLYDKLDGQKILHIATHGEFLPDDPKASYLLTGTGAKLPIYELEFLENLRNVHLVVLSACETALGGPDQNGVEIAGISSYFLQDKAKSVLASLWQVDDASTNQLMQTFYRQLSNAKRDDISKGEALRRAQVSLLTGKVATTSPQQRGSIAVVSKNQSKPKKSASKYSHPYYWAPFTLIGNSR